MYDQEPVVINDVVCKHATEKAILVIIEGDEVWIPQSHIHADSEVWKKGDVGSLAISPWIAEKHGLDY